MDTSSGFVPAYLHKPNRERKRAIIRAALGKRCRGYRYRNKLDYDLPIDVRDIRREQERFDRMWEIYRSNGYDLCAASKQALDEREERE